MSPEVSRDTLLAAAQDCGWPRVEWAGLTGEHGWRTARPTPGERRRLLATLASSLLELGKGAPRLQQYAAQTCVETPGALRRRIREALQFYGDEVMLTVTVEALARFLPEPVRAFTLKEVCFIAAGWSCRGWTAPLGLTHPDGQPRSQLIVLSGGDRDPDVLTRAILHEVSHAWAGDPSAPVTLLASGYEAAVLALAREEDWPALAAIPENEARTDRLALAWLCAAAEAEAGWA